MTTPSPPPPLVDFKSRGAYQRLFVDLGVPFEYARRLERAAFDAATRNEPALSNSGDALAFLHAPGDVAQRVCAAYCAALRRAATLLTEFGPVPVQDVPSLGCLSDSEALAWVRARRPTPGPWIGAATMREEAAIAALKRAGAGVNESASGVKDSVFACPYCGSHNVDDQAVQARSLDEGQTIFLKCLNAACGKQSRLNT